MDRSENGMDGIARRKIPNGVGFFSSIRRRDGEIDTVTWRPVMSMRASRGAITA